MKKETILKFYQTYKLYIFPTIVALSSLILIVLVIYPQTIKLISSQKVKGDILNKSKFLEAKAQALESLDPTDLNRKKDFALYSYPTDKDFVSVLTLLQDLASQSGFSIISMSLGSGTLSTNAQSYSLKIDISGPRSLLPILLSNIESSPRLMRVASVETTTTIALAVDVLYSSAPKEFGSVDSPLPELSEKDEEVLAKLARVGTLALPAQTPTQLGPRGKPNPFE